MPLHERSGESRAVLAVVELGQSAELPPAWQKRPMTAAVAAVAGAAAEFLAAADGMVVWNSAGLPSGQAKLVPQPRSVVSAPLQSCHH